MSEPAQPGEAPAPEPRESMGRRLLLSPLLPVSWAWRIGARLHRASFAVGLLRSERLPCAVVAVGSPLAGGTGKTPVAAHLAAALSARGHKVVVASRGYGRRRSLRGEPPVRVVSDGQRLWGSAEACGDEPMWIAARCPGVPVLVARERAAAGRMACSVFGAEVLVLDDGLQHHRLEHDVAIATLDGGRGFGNRHGLPRGPLREAPSMLRRCDALVTIGQLGRDAPRVEKLAGGLERVSAEREIVGVRALGRRELLPAKSLEGLEVGLLAAIARPQSLRASVEACGGRVVAEKFFRDHHRYRERDVRKLQQQAPIWLTSEKDAVKLSADWVHGVDVRVAVSELRFAAGDAFVDWVIERAALRRR